MARVARYDLPSTLPYRTTTMAWQKLGKKFGFSRGQLLTFAMGQSDLVVARVLDEALGETESALDGSAASPYPGQQP